MPPASGDWVRGRWNARKWQSLKIFHFRRQWARDNRFSDINDKHSADSSSMETIARLSRQLIRNYNSFMSSASNAWLGIVIAETIALLQSRCQWLSMTIYRTYLGETDPPLVLVVGRMRLNHVDRLLCS